METNTIELLLISVISEETGCAVTLETRVEELGDSLDYVNLLMVIGEKFKSIPSAKVAEIETVSDILKAIE